jgi:hypothetical protein
VRLGWERYKNANRVDSFIWHLRVRLFFSPNFPRAMFIQGGTFIPDSRVRKPWQMMEKLGIMNKG